MEKNDKNKSEAIYNTAHCIVDKIEEIQDEARDLLSMIEDLPLSIGIVRNCKNIPSQWNDPSAFNLLSIDFPQESIATTGSGPWEEDQFDSLIKGLDNEVHEIDGSVYIVVVGYKTDKINQIRNHIEKSENIIQVYPQELFLSYLFTGVDPLPLLT